MQSASVAQFLHHANNAVQQELDDEDWSLDEVIVDREERDHRRHGAGGTSRTAQSDGSPELLGAEGLSHRTSDASGTTWTWLWVAILRFFLPRFEDKDVEEEASAPRPAGQGRLAQAYVSA